MKFCLSAAHSAHVMSCDVVSIFFAGIAMDLSVLTPCLGDSCADFDMECLLAWTLGICIAAGAAAAAAFYRKFSFFPGDNPVKLHGPVAVLRSILVTTTLSLSGLAALQGGTYRPPWEAQPRGTELHSVERDWTKPVQVVFWCSVSLGKSCNPFWCPLCPAHRRAFPAVLSHVGRKMSRQ